MHINTNIIKSYSNLQIFKSRLQYLVEILIFYTVVYAAGVDDCKLIFLAF